MLCSFIARSPFHSETRPFPLFLKPALGSLTVMRTTEDLQILAFGNQYPGIRRSLHSHPTSEEKKTLSHLPILYARYKYSYTILSSPSYRAWGFGLSCPNLLTMGTRAGARVLVFSFFVAAASGLAGWSGPKKRAQSVWRLVSYKKTSLIRLAFYLVQHPHHLIKRSFAGFVTWS